MQAPHCETLRAGQSMPRFDRLLRFDPVTEARYERETGRARALYQRRIVWFGLIFYNVTLVPGYLLAGDVFRHGLALKGLLITGMALIMAWSFVYLPAVWRERVTLIGIINAHLVFALLFAATQADLGAYTFADQILTVVYGNMVLALRFRHAAAFTAMGMAVSLGAILLKPGLPVSLQVGLSTQILIAGIFSLAANYQMERRRCVDYVSALTALLRAERAEVSEQALTAISRTDALTGLPNRRYLEEVLADWCAGPQRLWVMMIDVDHFKLYNDSLGHPAGDDCLRHLARALRAAIKGHDAFCARLGGEEFVIVLRDDADAAGHAVAAQVTAAVRALAIPHPGRHDHHAIVTVSVGLADSLGGQRTADQLLANADIALYQAKHAGRDRVVAFAATRRRAIRSA